MTEILCLAVGFAVGKFWPQVKLVALWAYARVTG